MKCIRSAVRLAMPHMAVLRNTILSLLALIIVICSPMVHGQTSAGTIAGTVVDPSDHPVNGATTVLTNNATGEKATAHSNEAGTFRFNDVKPGMYSAVTTAAGFRKSEQSGIEVSISQTVALNVKLEIGRTSETVTVDASSTDLQTESSDIGTSVGPEFVENLPLSVGNGSKPSVVDFIFLAPGVVGSDSVDKIGGGQATGSTVQVDGGSIDTITGGNYDAPTYTPSVDAVQVFTILESGYPAQYGRTTGGIVNFGTLFGTDQFHGKVYDRFHNTVLDANSWWNNLEAAAHPANASSYARPVDMKNDYGFTVGGPVRIPHFYDGRKRTFFYYSWEQFRQNLGNVVVETVPTQANRNGDFSATLTNTVIGTNPCDGQPIYEGEIFDPTTTQQVGTVYCRTPFAYNGELNHINPAVFSKVAENVISYMPLPQNSSLTQNYTYRNSVPYLITAETIRIDHSFNDKDKIFASYNPQRTWREHVNVVIPGPGSAGLNQTTFMHDFHLGYDHTFSQSTFNHLVISTFRFTNAPKGPSLSDGTNWPVALGIGSNLGGDAFPQFAWGENYIGMGSAYDYVAYQNHGEIDDNFLHIFGKHTLNVGASARYTEYSQPNYGSAAGGFGFGRRETAGTNLLTTESGNGFASFLLGQVEIGAAIIPVIIPEWRQEYAALYVQDDYKPMPNLTLNLGLRYDVDVPWSEHYGNVNNWNPTLPDTNVGNGVLGGLVFSGTGPGRSGLSSRLADTYYKDIAPRLGFAWSPRFLNGKTVIRGNWGFMYGPMPMDYPYNALNADYGFSVSPTFRDTLQTGGFTAPYLLDSGFPAYTKSVNTNPFQLDNTGDAAPYVARSYGRVATIENYGLEIQQQLPSALVLSLAYTGNRGTHLSSRLVCPDCLAQKYYSLGSQLSQTYSATKTSLSGYNIPYSGFTGSLAQGLQPFPQIGSITTENENIGQSSYNALYAKLQRSFKSGFSMLASYTWSKTFTDADSLLIGELGGGYQNPFDLKGEKAISADDYPQVLAVSEVLELPFGRSKPFLNSGGFLNAVVGGWSIGGLQKAQSGSAANFGCATGLPGDSPCFRFSLNAGVSVYSTAKQSGQFNPLVDRYFNTAAFVDPNANSRIAAGGGYQYGTLRRYVPSIRYPVSPDSDFSFMKENAIAEGMKVQFRAELFNAFNQHRLGSPNQSPNSTAFGEITGTENSARVGQLTLRVTF